MKLLSPSVSTKHPTSEESLHPKSFQSWRWVFLAAILLAAVTISTFYFSSAQAQANKGAITGLTLTSDAPGTLTVSWDAASPVPTDYRVDWAKSTEDYKSWKVDDGHVYTAETVTTTTITDLAHDTEYKIRMRARYYRGEHEGKSWGGPWAEATITVAGEPAETPTPEPVQQPAKEDPVQEEPTEEDTTAPAGTIETLTGTDDNTGQLVLSWSAPAAPNATPTDYHVSWAKSSEDYPADTAEAGNAHPTTTTHTLPDLEYDTDYNVRVRAHYSDGENADSPWNGPWTETTTQVKLPLPEAPFIGATAVTPDGDVLLSWFNPDQNDSITGYQILRGPDADNLAVIEDDTGSSSTIYTDTAPPAGQTHTYAVKARNASGLGPQSDTGTATVPEPEEELVTAQQSSEETLVSNLGKTTNSESATAGTASGTHREIAVPFTTGSNALGYHLTSLQLYLTRLVRTDTPNPEVSIRADNGGSPSETILYTLTTSTAITISWNLVTFTTTDDFTLQPNTTYWLHVTATTGEVLVQQTTSNDEDAESQEDWQIGNVRSTRTDGGAWIQFATNNTLKTKILGHVITPEPTGTTLVSNLGKTTNSESATAGTASGTHREIAVPFTTGSNALGYHLTSLQLYLTRLVRTDTPNPEVSIRADNGGSPSETILYTLTTSTAITISWNLVTFTTTDDFTLQPNTTYWLHVTATTGEVLVQQTTSNDEDAESQEDWQIGNVRSTRTDGGAWIQFATSNTLKTKILGHVITPDTLVSNLGQTAVSGDAQAGFVSGNHHETATSFTTGTYAFGYQPTSIQLYLSRLSGSPIVYIIIREDNAGLPSETALARLNMSTAITADANIPQLITFTTSGEVTLQPDTLYWLHVNASPSLAPAGVRQTASDDEDTESQAGWSIGDHRVSRIDGGAWTTPTSRNSLQMRILGHIILPTIVDLSADITTTARLAVNESVTGQHEHGRDVDWFAFAAEADTNYQFTANQGQKFATLNVLRIFQDDGTELRNSLIAKKDGAYHAVDRLNNIAFRTDTASTYYVSIEGWNGGGSNVPYTLAMFDDDYSDDITTTGVVDVGESFQNYVMRTGANPESSRTDDVDWIRVALKADVTYEIVYDVACLHQGRIEGIYGPDGTLLPDTTLDWPRKTKGWCTDLTTEFTPSSDDDYYIAVSAQGSRFPRTDADNPFQGVQGTLTITAK